MKTFSAVLSIPVASHTHQEDMKICHWTGFLLCVFDDLTAHPLLWESGLLLSPTIKYHTGQSFKWCTGDASQTMWLGLDNRVHAVDGFMFCFFSSVMALWMPLWQFRVLDHHFWRSFSFCWRHHEKFLFLWITNVGQKKGILVLKCGRHEFKKCNM